MVRHGSLFAGIGGFDLGFERAGIETVWTVENDKNCNEVLATYWPNVERHEDVREVGKHNLESVDLISGGFPCQDLSVAGRREGLAGERSGLWFEFARVIGEMEPQWVVVENVPGLFSSGGGRDFLVIVRALEQFGYCVAWRVLDSQFFGVPQRRRRVFIVGSLGNAGSIEVLFESEGGEGHPAEGGEEGQGTAAPVERGAIGFDWQQAGDALDECSQTLSVTRVQAYLLNEDKIGPLDTQVMATCDQTVDSNQIQLDAMGVRRLTPTECERLQGFPNGWTEGLSDTQRYKTLGNAVTVSVAEWIGRRIAP